MKQLLDQFRLDGEIVSIESHGNGHINKTFLVQTTNERYVFQYVNHNVFPDICGLMNNIRLVTEHLLAKGQATLEIVPAKDGSLFVQDGEDYFRGYRFIPNCVCPEKLDSLEMVREAAKGFGAFHQGLADLSAEDIVDVIPFFHDTKKRFQDFKKAVEANPKDRVANAEEEVGFLLSRESDYSLLVDALEKGEINLSITHNDPKINNVAFDKNSGKFICVLDLDTVMKGTFLYDVGDGLRSLFTGDNEDSLDLARLVVDMAIYEAYIDGYLSMMKDVILPKEIELLPYSILVITEELAMRFLGDYINGDVYFGIGYPRHNLDRARTQIALAKDIIAHMDELVETTSRIAKKYIA